MFPTKLLRFATGNLHLNPGQEAVLVRRTLVIAVMTIANIYSGLILYLVLC